MDQTQWVAQEDKDFIMGALTTSLPAQASSAFHLGVDTGGMVGSLGEADTFAVEQMMKNTAAQGFHDGLAGNPAMQPGAMAALGVLPSGTPGVNVPNVGVDLYGVYQESYDAGHAAIVLANPPGTSGVKYGGPFPVGATALGTVLGAGAGIGVAALAGAKTGGSVAGAAIGAIVGGVIGAVAGK